MADVLGILFGIYGLGVLVVTFIFIVAKAIVFHKADLPWVLALIPIVSLVCLSMIAFGKSKWYYVFLMLVPLGNLIFFR